VDLISSWKLFEYAWLANAHLANMHGVEDDVIEECFMTINVQFNGLIVETKVAGKWECGSHKVLHRCGVENESNGAWICSSRYNCK